MPERASIIEKPDLSGFVPKTVAGEGPAIEQLRAVGEASNYKSREPQPARAKRVYRTGRNVQFNAKISQSTFDTIYAVTEQQGWVLGETLQHAMAAFLREQESTRK